MYIEANETGFAVSITQAEANVMASLLREVGGDAENEVLFHIFEGLTHQGVPADLAVEAMENTDEERELYGKDINQSLCPSHRLVI